ncbi:MAG TPA: MBL fold metallo-hydrolase [Thermodesulfobacteriota bacterium]|nr:MBL fold metallo-hydrolase [Thermodesulfobacteriota bacterium]
MRQIDRLTVHVVVDNITDMLSSRPGHVTSELRVLIEAGMKEAAGESLCSAHHGLCLAVTAHAGEETHTVLFDAGPDPYALERNGRHMNLNFGRIEALVLSHGHFDHSEGLLKALELIQKENGGRTIPLHVHPGAFVKRGMRLPSGEILPFQDVPSKRVLEENGARVLASTEPEEIMGGIFYLSGEIPRRSFERGLKNHLRKSADVQWEADPLIMDERFMAAHVKGKGIVIFTGCSHAGVLNICSHAQEVFPDIPLYALVGGLHLVNPNEDIIEETVTELRKFDLKIIIPGHCTGWRAIYALVNAFGEDVVDPLAVGSRQTL